MMLSSAYYFEVTVRQILTDICPFESFSKLFAAYCLEVIVVQILVFNRYIFLQITKVMAIWASYLFIYFFFFIIFFY